MTRPAKSAIDAGALALPAGADTAGSTAGALAGTAGAGAGAVSGTLANTLLDLTSNPGSTRLTGTSRGG